MNDNNYQKYTDYENKILKGLAEIKEGQEMIIEGNRKIQDGKSNMSYGIGGMADEIEKLEFNKKKLEEETSFDTKEKTIGVTDIEEQAVMNEQSYVDEQAIENELSEIGDSHEEEKEESNAKVFVKKKKLVKREKKRSAESIARDFDMFGDGNLDDEEEYVIIEVEEEVTPKGERIRTGEYEGEGGLLNRRDRNRIIIIFFIAGMVIAILRAIIEGWPMIVWPPYNLFEVHENSLFRRFVRWFVDILICETILDFDIDPIEDDERDGNFTLYIDKKYRGIGAYNSLTKRWPSWGS